MNVLMLERSRENSLYLLSLLERLDCKVVYIARNEQSLYKALPKHLPGCLFLGSNLCDESLIYTLNENLPQVPFVLYPSKGQLSIPDVFQYKSVVDVLVTNQPKLSRLNTTVLRAKAFLDYQNNPENIDYKRQAVFVVNRYGQRFFVHINSISYFKTQDKYVGIYWTGGVDFIYNSLNAIEKTLKHAFIRTHRRYLVSANKIERIEGNFMFLTDVEEAIPISRRMACNIRQYIKNFTL